MTKDEPSNDPDDPAKQWIQEQRRQGRLIASELDAEARNRRGPMQPMPRLRWSSEQLLLAGFRFRRDDSKCRFAGDHLKLVNALHKATSRCYLATQEIDAWAREDLPAADLTSADYIGTRVRMAIQQYQDAVLRADRWPDDRWDMSVGRSVDQYPLRNGAEKSTSEAIASAAEKHRQDLTTLIASAVFMAGGADPVSPPARTPEEQKMPAEHFFAKYGIKPDTLRQAKNDGRLKPNECEKRSGRYFYLPSAVAKLWPEEMTPDLPA